MLRAAARWGQTLRHHRPEQLVRRLWNRCRDRLPPPRLDGAALPLRAAAFDVAGLPIPAGAPRIDAADLARGRLSLLNVEYRFEGWRRPTVPDPNEGTPRSSLPPTPTLPPKRGEGEGLPALAAFQLHYMEYLLPNAAAEPELAGRWLAEWAAAFPNPGRGPAWHPYVISRRLPVWLRLLHTTALPHAEELTRSAARQARWLARRFERDLGGNHLWDNARALLIAGCAFDGPEADRWRAQGAAVLAECRAAQLLPSGEHYERSPGYQTDLARGLHEAAAWLAPVDAKLAGELADDARRMFAFADGLRHPDGGLPMFSDTTLDGDVATPPTDTGSGWHGDYYVHRPTTGDVLVFDAGAHGPDDLPAHAHADLLNAEISRGGRRLLVDSGVFAYAGPRRAEFRRTDAHNVLRVDGEELADVWGSFRMGRRGTVVERAAGSVEGGRWTRASHDGYRHRGVRVERLWVLADDGPWFSVHLAHGGEGRRLEEFLHWHPNAWDGAVPAVWEAASPLAVAKGIGSWSPRWSVAEQNEIWTLTPIAGEIMMVWALSPRACQPTARRDGRTVWFEWTATNGTRRSATAPLAG